MRPGHGLGMLLVWDSPSPASEESPVCAGMCAESTEVPLQHHPEGLAFLEAQECSAYGPAPGSVPVFIPSLLWAKPCKC